MDAWLAAAGGRGLRLDLATLWRFASRWYEGRLGYGYTRRDPATAQQYFRECGLAGPFWGSDQASATPHLSVKGPSTLRSAAIRADDARGTEHARLPSPTAVAAAARERRAGGGRPSARRRPVARATHVLRAVVVWVVFALGSSSRPWSSSPGTQGPRKACSS